jgi:hypothetical protein
MQPNEAAVARCRHRAEVPLAGRVAFLRVSCKLSPCCFALERRSLHYRPARKSPADLFLQWNSVDLISTQSCLGPWSSCTIPAPKDEDNSVKDCQLEFVIDGPDSGLDKPRHADSYRLHGPGGYKLVHGVLKPFPQACHAPYMLVCPLPILVAPSPDEPWCLLAQHILRTLEGSKMQEAQFCLPHCRAASVLCQTCEG